MAPPGRLLDIGCGAGEFMELATAAGFQTEGIEISEASVAICRRRGLNVRLGNLITENLDQSYDLITLWDVLPHLRDPAAFLARSRDLLTDRGYIFAKIPLFGALSVNLSNGTPKLAGLLIGAPSHIHYFNWASLTKVLLRVGLQWEIVAGGSARSSARGGPLKRRMARYAAGIVRWISGDRNAYFVAWPKSRTCA